MDFPVFKIGLFQNGIAQKIPWRAGGRSKDDDGDDDGGDGDDDGGDDGDDGGDDGDGRRTTMTTRTEDEGRQLTTTDDEGRQLTTTDDDDGRGTTTMTVTRTMDNDGYRWIPMDSDR